MSRCALCFVILLFLFEQLYGSMHLYLNSAIVIRLSSRVLIHHEGPVAMQLREWRMAHRLGLANAPPLPHVAMMVELRPDPALFRTIAVLHKNLLPAESWPIQIFHGAHNKQVVRLGGHFWSLGNGAHRQNGVRFLRVAFGSSSGNAQPIKGCATTCGSSWDGRAHYAGGQGASAARSNAT